MPLGEVVVITEGPLPRLTGTDPQIRWAEDIRAKRLKPAASILHPDSPIPTDYDVPAGMYERTRAWLRNQTDANWWIDTDKRFKALEDFAHFALAMACLDTLQRHPELINQLRD